MDLRIHEVDVVRDRERMVAFLKSQIEGHYGRAHYDWLYLRNPAGQARAWFAEHQATGRLVGAAAAFPRLVRVRGATVTGWNLGDFAVAPECRSLGPAVKLQRACLAPVLEGAVPFAFDHPSPTMAAVYRRLGFGPTGSIVRAVHILRANAQCRQKVKIAPLADALGAIGNVVLSLRRPFPATGHVMVREFPEASGRRAAALWGSYRPDADVAIDRAPEYLEWRYRECPVYRFETRIALDGDQPVGFVVFRQAGRDHAVVADLVAPPDAAASLLSSLAATLRTRGVSAVSVPLLDGGREPFPARDWGFVPRESSPFVVTVAPDSEFAGVVDRAANWYLANGDRDV